MAPPLDPGNASHHRAFRWWVEYGSAACIGGMAGFLLALKRVNPEIVLAFDGVAMLGMAGGFFGTLAAWRWTAKADPQDPLRERRIPRARWMTFGILLALMFSFAYPLKDVAADKRSDILIGAACAVAVLTVVGTLIWKAARFFDDGGENGPTDRPY